MTDRQAFEAMVLFLNQYYDRAGDDLRTLLADTHIEADGQPGDPAAWDDWVQCVALVLGRSGTQSDER